MNRDYIESKVENVTSNSARNRVEMAAEQNGGYSGQIDTRPKYPTQPMPRTAPKFQNRVPEPSLPRRDLQTPEPPANRMPSSEMIPPNPQYPSSETIPPNPQYPSTPPNPSSKSTPTTEALSEEERRSAVYEIQLRLNEVMEAARENARKEGRPEGVIAAIPTIVPDGIYGPETSAAAALFQLMAGLPVTGEVDFRTWTELCRAHLAAEERKRPPEGIRPFGAHLYREEITPGEESIYATIVQIMLTVLAVRYTTYEPPAIDGVYGGKTEAAVRRFQEINRLPVTGAVDRRTWNRMAEQFNVYVGEE